MSLTKQHGSRFSAAVMAFVFAGGLFASAFQGPGGQGQPPGGGGGGRGGPAGGGPPGGGAGGRGQGQGRGAGPARDANTPAPVGTGGIAGAVTIEGGGTPVRRAQVTLSGAELRGNRTTTTNDRGQFSFVALPAGRFTLTVSKPGYVGLSYGAKKPGRQGTPIQLADGQKLDNADISLPRGSVITGVVVDETGEPSPNTQVRAYRYVLANGQRTLQNASQDQTDDRGIYRMFQLQPGDYMVSASPRNQGGAGAVRAQLQTQLEPLLQQLQAVGGANGGRGAGGGQGLAALNNLMGGGRGQQILDQVQQLQQQLQQQPDEQSTAYAPVYYPGTTSPAAASKVTLGIGEEKAGVDFQLQLVPTARVQGTVVGAEATLAQGTQISLVVAGQQDAPTVPGASMNMTRVAPDGKFSFQNIAPGQYTLMVRSAVRQAADPAAVQDPQAGVGPRGGGAGGRGGRAGGPGAITQVLWASADITVDGRDISDVSLSLAAGHDRHGPDGIRRRERAAAERPVSLTGNADVRGISTRWRSVRRHRRKWTRPATSRLPALLLVDTRFAGNVVAAPAQGAAGAAGAFGAGAGGRGGLAGLAAGRAGGAGGAGGWTLKSALVNGVDTLDFPLEIKPNEAIHGAVLTFTDKTQELSGTLQDAMGKPTADFTIILFSADKQFWTPLSRRILSTRPSTDGKFTFRNLPAGQYRLTAVTDAEQGEWFDPGFLSQLAGASVPVTIGENEKKVQDIRLAGGH